MYVYVNKGKIPTTHTLPNTKCPPLQPHRLDSSPREDLWAEWLEPLTKWQTFGLFLPGIKQKDIDKIEEDKTGVESRKMGLWTKWTGVYPPGTWADVISALKRLRENALAVDIEERLRKGKVFEIKSETLKGGREEYWRHLNTNDISTCICVRKDYKNGEFSPFHFWRNLAHDPIL